MKGHKMRIRVTLKRLLKILIIIISLLIFYHYFFKDVINKYFDQMTNIATEDKELHKDENGFQSPTFTICMQPQRRPSIYDKYNVTDAFFTAMMPGSYEHLIHTNKSLSDITAEASFKLGEDFDLRLGELLNFGSNLKLGTNINKIYGQQIIIEISQLYSQTHGPCYKMSLNATIHSKHGGYLLSSQIKGENPIESMALVITSENNYMASVIGIWKKLKPIELKIDFGPGLSALDLQETTTELIKNCDNEYDNHFHCLSKKIATHSYENCPRKCVIPNLKAYFEYVNEPYELCTNVTEDRCIMVEITAHVQEFTGECKMQCKRTEYLGENKRFDTQLGGNDSAFLALYTSHNSRIVNTEYYVYDAPGMIGNIGGCLGLFFGFSFYGAICDILDFLIKD